MPTLLTKPRTALKESKMRMGQVLKSAIPVLILSHFDPQSELTVKTLTDLINDSDELRESGAAVDISSVRRAIARLARTYVEPVGTDVEDADWEPVLVVTEHENETWFGRDGKERSVGVVTLTSGGFKWATTYLASSTRDASSARHVVTQALAG